MVPQVLIDLARPVAIVLLSGLLTGLYNYQNTGSVKSAAVNGAAAAASVALAQLGVKGAVVGIQSSAQKAALKDSGA